MFQLQKIFLEGETLENKSEDNFLFIIMFAPFIGWDGLGTMIYEWSFVNLSEY